VVEQLGRDGIQFKSLTESIDTTTPNGGLMYHMFGAFGAFAKFERNLIRERTNVGLAAAQSRGKVGGEKKPSIPDCPKTRQLTLTGFWASCSHPNVITKLWCS